jgi:hypothetical protein
VPWRPPGRITPSFGQPGRCPKLPNNSRELPLHLSWPRHRLRGRGGRVALPRSGQPNRQGSSQPQLDIGQTDQLPPLFLVFDTRGLVPVQQQLGLAKPEEVFQVIALAVSLIRLDQGDLPPSRTQYQQPQRPLKPPLALRLRHGGADQVERPFLHGCIVLATHPQIMPAVQLDLPPSPRPAVPIKFRGSVRWAQGLRRRQFDRLPIPPRMPRS